VLLTRERWSMHRHRRPLPRGRIFCPSPQPLHPKPDGPPLQSIILSMNRPASLLRGADELLDMTGISES
jgi:hypothetical protein